MRASLSTTIKSHPKPVELQLEAGCRSRGIGKLSMASLCAMESREKGKRPRRFGSHRLTVLRTKTNLSPTCLFHRAVPPSPCMKHHALKHEP